MELAHSALITFAPYLENFISSGASILTAQREGFEPPRTFVTGFGGQRNQPLCHLCIIYIDSSHPVLAAALKPSAILPGT